MVEDAFVVDPRIVAESVVLAEGRLSHVRLMDDARFPWLLLLPRRAGLVELTDLGVADRALLMEEIAVAGTALKAAMPFEKLNVAALGNIVTQLHVHVVGRSPGDAAWPGPVWGSGARQPRTPLEAAALLERLREALRAAGWQGRAD